MMRAFSRILVPDRLRKDPRYGEDFATKVILGVTLRVAFILLLPSFVAIGLTWQEARARSDANRERIAEENKIRQELARGLNRRIAESNAIRKELAREARRRDRGFKRADVISCREREALKAQNREDARETFRNLERNLRILEIENTPEIQALALANLQRDLTRNPARPGGCGNLPPKLEKGGD